MLYFEFETVLSASSQSLCFILSLRLYSSFITSRPGLFRFPSSSGARNCHTCDGFFVHLSFNYAISKSLDRIQPNLLSDLQVEHASKHIYF